jgi:hypothetical protein
MIMMACCSRCRMPSQRSPGQTRQA